MEYIKGKIRNIIYQNTDNGYTVAVFRIKETNDSLMQDYLNKSVTITGVFLDINSEDTYILKGEYLKHERFGFQYNVKSYEREEPTTESGVIEFLASPLIKGCGEKTAIKIVETLGVDAVKLIKENKDNLLLVSGMSEAKAEKIYNSIIAHQSADDILIKLKKIIKKALKYIIETIVQSRFEVLGTELEFGEKGKYKPIRLTLDNGKTIKVIMCDAKGTDAQYKINGKTVAHLLGSYYDYLEFYFSKEADLNSVSFKLGIQSKFQGKIVKIYNETSGKTFE